ncbi:MAG: Gfo/Idh/MocA family oxidoreductase [bacterium]
MKKIKLGIIGLGHMGGYHASASSLINDAELIAVADPDKKNWEKIKSKKIITSINYKNWINDVNAVIIAVPTELHHEIAKNCLLSGKHVLLEKPLTKTVEQAKELFKIAKEKKLALHVGHVERFNGAIQEVKKRIKAPDLIECHRMGPYSSRVQKDSVVLDLMIHDLDLVLSLVDSPVKSFNVFGKKIKTDSCDIATAQIEFENGTIANITSSRASHIKKRTMSIHQQNSFINLDFTTQDISIYRNPTDSVQIGTNELKYKQEKTIENLIVYNDNPLKLEIENFIKAIKTKTKLIDEKQDTTALKLTLEIEKRLGL